MSQSFCKITLKPLSSESEQKLGYTREGLKALFDTSAVNPVMAMTRADFMQGFKASQNRMSISGVQPKRSAVLNGNALAMTDTGGQYIIKPSPEEYPNLAEVEHACMAMTQALSRGGRLTVAKHGLFELSDGELVYVTRRFDRLADGTKLQQEQLDAAMGVADKYDENVSYERIGRFIQKNVSVPLPALMAFYEQVIISFMLGNDDLHIRNLGIQVDLSTGKATGLTPAYDIVASSLYTNGGSYIALPLTIEDEIDQQGTTLGMAEYGYYTGKDFINFGTGVGLSATVAARTLKRIVDNVPNAKILLERSFMPDEKKQAHGEILDQRVVMLSKGI